MTKMTLVGLLLVAVIASVSRSRLMARTPERAVVVMALAYTSALAFGLFFVLVEWAND